MEHGEKQITVVDEQGNEQFAKFFSHLNQINSTNHTYCIIHLEQMRMMKKKSKFMLLHSCLVTKVKKANYSQSKQKKSGT